MALLLRRPRHLKAPEAGAGVEEASKLLRSVCSNTEGLTSEIQSCGHRRRAVQDLAAELQTLRDAMLRIWDALLDAADLHRPSSQGTALALQARDAPPPARLWRNPLLSRLLGCDGSSCKPNKKRKVLFVVTQETIKLLGLLDEGAAATSLHPPLLASPDQGCVKSQTQLPRPKGTVVGRDMDREAILRMLTDPCPQPGPLVISIVGMGGVGIWEDRARQPALQPYNRPAAL